MQEVLKDSQYYYELSQYDFRKIENMKYKDALQYKIECAERVLGTLLDENYMKRNYHRINDICKAISFNQKLINELN